MHDVGRPRFSRSLSTPNILIPMEALLALNPAKALKRRRSISKTPGTHQSGSFRPLGKLIEEHFSNAEETESPSTEFINPATSAPTPLTSVDAKTWGLHKGLVKALESEGIVRFFPVQRALVPLLLTANKWDDPTLGDVCVSAPTGSGKTLAYGLPLLDFVLKERDSMVKGACRALHALIVLPTRDLAVQVHSVLARLAHVAGGGINILAVMGQSSYATESEALERSLLDEPVDILVASPGRLMEHLDSTPALTEALRGLRVLVVDEADRLLSESYQDWVRRINMAIFRAEDPGLLGSFSGSWNAAGLEPQSGGLSLPLSTFLSQQPTPDSPSQLSREWHGEGSRVGGVLTKIPLPPPLAPLFEGSTFPSWIASALPDRGAREKSSHNKIFVDPLSTPFRRILCSATLTRNPQKMAIMGLRHPLYIIAGGPGRNDECGNKGTELEELETDGNEIDGGIKVSSVGAAKLFTLPSTLRQVMCVCSADEKPIALHLLVKLLDGRIRHGASSVSDSPPKPPSLCALVFTNSVETAHRLTRLLQLLGGLQGSVVEFSASLSQVQRTAVLEAVSQGAISVLVASDAAARGLDIPFLPAVIHYEPPSQTKTYVHRVGRVARAGRPGMSYALLRSEQVRHFKGVLAGTSVCGVGGWEGIIKETLSKASISAESPRLQACLEALKGVLSEEAQGTLKLTKSVEALAPEVGEESGGVA